MKHLISIILMISMVTLGACSNLKSNTEDTKPTVQKPTQAELDKLSKAYFASGCFWCVEAIFESVKGVKEAVSGYAGGEEKNPSYRQVSAGSTGHTEAVLVYYDPAVVSYETLLKVYYGSHDPTTVNGQYPDFGTQYRSVIFYTNEEEKKLAEAFKADLDASGQYSEPIATEIVPHTKFWPAEDYHQDYEKNNPNQPYVRSVSIPRLKRFQAKFPELLKDGH
jgi:peptide-methionine (S)-S-oxide reductase